jgi:hypothetical protein
MPKRVGARVPYVIIVDEHPIEGCVEGHEQRLLSNRHHLPQPIRKALQRLGRRNAVLIQIFHVQAVHRHRLWVAIVLVGSQLDIKGASRLAQRARPNRKQRVAGWNRSSRFHIDGDISAHFIFDSRCHK